MTTALGLSRPLLTVLSSVLEPDEVTFYLACKLLPGEKLSIPAVCAILGGKGRPAVARMKERGLLPAGKLDLTHLDDVLRDAASGKLPAKPASVVDDEDAQKARVLVAHQKTKMHAIDPKMQFADSWFGRNYRIALAALHRDKVPFDDIFECLNWIYDSVHGRTYLAPHCDGMSKALQYVSRFRMQRALAAQNSAPASMQQMHEKAWSTGA